MIYNLGNTTQEATLIKQQCGTCLGRIDNRGVYVRGFVVLLGAASECGQRKDYMDGSIAKHLGDGHGIGATGKYLSM